MTTPAPILKAKNPLAYLLNSELSLNAKRDFITNVMVALDISLSTFYRKVGDPSQFSPSDKNTIAKLAGKNFEDLFPETPTPTI